MENNTEAKELRHPPIQRSLLKAAQDREFWAEPSHTLKGRLTRGQCFGDNEILQVEEPTQQRDKYTEPPGVTVHARNVDTWTCCTRDHGQPGKSSLIH